MAGVTVWAGEVRKFLLAITGTIGTVLATGLIQGGILNSLTLTVTIIGAVAAGLVYLVPNATTTPDPAPDPAPEPEQPPVAADLPAAAGLIDVKLPAFNPAPPAPPAGPKAGDKAL